MPLAVKLLAAWVVAVSPAKADRPIEIRDKASHIVTGVVEAVYVQQTKGYSNYIVEIKVEEVEKGAGVAKGDTFRAFCYQRKAGAGGLEFDTAGHDVVPKEGMRVKAFVKHQSGRNEGVYPDWVDVQSNAQK